jgi:hypothetical protein
MIKNFEREMKFTKPILQLMDIEVKGLYMKRLSVTNTGTVFKTLLFHINLQIDLLS